MILTGHNSLYYANGGAVDLNILEGCPLVSRSVYIDWSASYYHLARWLRRPHSSHLSARYYTISALAYVGSSGGTTCPCMIMWAVW